MSQIYRSVQDVDVQKCTLGRTTAGHAWIALSWCSK
jgi:hypothetical protein